MTEPVQDALAGRRILVVEDELLLAMDLQMILEDAGCVVLGPVPDEKRALKLLSEQRPDAATLDLNLNGKPSLPIAKALAEMAVPFVVISGYNNRTETEPALREAPYIAKPVDAVLLLQKLGEVLNR